MDKFGLGVIYPFHNKTMLNINLGKIMLTVVLVVLSILVGWAVLIGLDKDISVYCRNLKRQSIEFKRGFYISQNDKQMCLEIGVEIDAPTTDPYEPI